MRTLAQNVLAAKFAGVGRVARHRMVNAALGDLRAGRVHAMAIAAHAPGEAIGGSG